MSALYPASVQVFRLQDVLDQYKSPIRKEWQPVGAPLAGRLRAKSLSAVPGEAQTTLVNVYTVYLEDPKADIRAGDLVEIAGVRYRCAEPYRPGGHHVEVAAAYEGAA